MWRATYPLSGHLFVFRGRRSDISKIIWDDGLGACLFTRLEYWVNLMEWLHDFEACGSSCGPCERLYGAAFRA
ncbi:IS66 family insertion sequence element accessory protein TnpB [Sinorhizobium meliloti]